MIKSGMRITKDDAAKLQASVLALAKRQVLIGIPKDTATRREIGTSNAEIGYIQEFGSAVANIPPRPFLRPGVKDAQPRAIQALKTFAARALKDSSQIDKGLNAAGQIAADAVRRRIVRGISPLLKPGTIRARRSRRVSGQAGTKPLIDTGQLLNSITYVVRAK